LLVLAIVGGVLMAFAGSTLMCCLGVFWIAAKNGPAVQIVDSSIPLDEELNVTYVHREDRPLKLDIFSPRGLRKPTPLVVCIHGGGWKAGRKEDFAQYGRYYAQQGFVAVSVQYRLAPADRYPAQIEDVKCAIRWLRANAEQYYIDGDRVAVVGASAGGHLALLAGLMDDQEGVPPSAPHADQSNKAQAIVNYFGPADFTQVDWPPAVEQMLVTLMGGNRTVLAERYKAASPVTYIDADDPPVLTFHGANDALVPHNQATGLHAALDAANIENHLETLPGQGHGFAPSEMLRTLEASKTFLIKHLGNPATVSVNKAPGSK